jgi:hypothetical protein
MKTLGGLDAINGLLLAPPVHIPDEKGGAYKTELSLIRTMDRAEKIIWWHGSDPRTEPHNHPWPFESSILSGGYTEHRWWKENGVWKTDTVIYRAGNINKVDSNVFHVVVNVQPETVTHVVCGKNNDNKWGYLDLNLEYIPAKPEAKFREALLSLNPHLR